MIGKLTGLVDSSGEDWALIDVGGVGYVVFCSGRTLGRLPAPGLDVSLLIETHVREDHIHLYGFAEAEERDWFRTLTQVQGVGVKVALALLTVLSADDLIQAIAAQDKASLTRANGVGLKLAGRIVSELRDKVGDIALGPAAATPAAVDGNGMTRDAVSALINLGYRRTEAFGAVAHARQRLGGSASIEDLVRDGLKGLGS